MWGQDLCFTNLCNGLRIIPTRVGTSVDLLPFCCHIKDHPHACGDKFLFANLATLIIGSSPRVWGQEPLEVQLTNGYRIIPTRVGTRELGYKDLALR